MEYDNQNKIEKGNKVKNKEGSTSQRNILMETTKPGKKSKKEARDPEWYRESKLVYMYKLLNENNGDSIREGQKCDLVAYTEIKQKQRSTGKMKNENKRHTGKDDGRQGSGIGKGRKHKFTGIIVKQWKLS